MNLLQKIYSKLEKKVNEVLMIRKFNSYIESNLVKGEEEKEKYLNLMKSNLETGDFYSAHCYFGMYLDSKREIEQVEAFKDFVLSEKDNTEN